MVVEYIIKTQSGSFYEIEERSPKDWFIHFKGAIYPILAFGQAPADVLNQKENKAFFFKRNEIVFFDNKKGGWGHTSPIAKIFRKIQ